jgi:hypothetical protein
VRTDETMAFAPTADGEVRDNVLGDGIMVTIKSGR